MSSVCQVDMDMEDEDDNSLPSFQETKSEKTALPPVRYNASEGIVLCSMNEKNHICIYQEFIWYFKCFSISGRLTTHHYRFNSQVASSVISFSFLGLFTIHILVSHIHLYCR